MGNNCAPTKVRVGDYNTLTKNPHNSGVQSDSSEGARKI